MKRGKLLVFSISLALIINGCAGMKTWQKGALKGAAVGTAVGAGIGAGIGAAAAPSDKEREEAGIGAGIGAVIGGIVGGILGIMTAEEPPPPPKVEEAPPPPPPPPPKVEKAPPPPPPAPPKRVVFQNILFDFDKAKIKPESIPILKVVVDYLKGNPDVDLSIEGHACWIGPDTYNQKLSEKRAESIKKYLISDDIEGNRLMTKGFGEEKPVADNKTREGRRLNRRVEVKIIEE
jgi:OOP family OmpA-OmpF porin